MLTSIDQYNLDKKILITGGVGFIGHHVIDYLLEKTNWQIISLDRIDVSSSLERLKQLVNWKEHYNTGRIKFIWHDLRAAINDSLIHKIGNVDYVLHLAASTHVDRSIEEPYDFIQDNIIGTYNVLEYIRHTIPEQYIYFSTDEIFGPAHAGVLYGEWARYDSRNPYAATKAAGEELSLAYANTYGIECIITHCMNVFGERQSPEKFIPLCIKKILNSEEILIHSSPEGKPGSRFYIYAKDVASALLFLLDKGEQREKYNIVGCEEVDNLQVAVIIANIMNRNVYFKEVDFHSARPGHDLRYALNGNRMFDMGYKHEYNFAYALQQTVNWYLNNQDWLYMLKKLKKN